MQVKGPAQQLADFMIKLSIKHYNTEWNFGFEYELWNEITGNQDILSAEEVSKLQEISEWCDGWIAMSYKNGKENLEFLSLDDWKVKYVKQKPF